MINTSLSKPCRYSNTTFFGHGSQLLDTQAQATDPTPSLTLKIGAHTNLRGTDQYNLWLSERRAQRTKEYLVNKGIDPNKLISEGHGEADLLNEFKVHTYCTEEKH